MISDHLRHAVQQQAELADNEKQIGGIIFSALRDSGIAWQHVDRDGVKQLVVDAVRAFRSAHNGSQHECSRPARGDRSRLVQHMAV